MKPILQTKFGGEEGNCLAACICSILEIDDLSLFDNLPNDERWFTYVNDILDRFDLYLCLVNFENPTYTIQGYHLILGDNLDKPYSHCQVGYNGHFYFDPMGHEVPLKSHRYGLFMKKFYLINMEHKLQEGDVNNSSNSQDRQQLTFGQRLVGLNFNPSNDPLVQKAKTLSAELIDLLHEEVSNRERSEISRILIDKTYGDILDAQMNVVKVLTLKY